MKTITVRTAESCHVGQLVRFQIAMAMESEGLELDPATVQEGVSGLIENRSRGQYFIAQDPEDPSGKVIGCMMVTTEWSDWNNAEYWWLQSVYVCPEYRRRGVFTQMVRWLQENMKSQNVKSLRLYVDKDNIPAQECYRRLGLEQSHYLIFEREV